MTFKDLTRLAEKTAADHIESLASQQACYERGGKKSPFATDWVQLKAALYKARVPNGATLRASNIANLNKVVYRLVAKGNHKALDIKAEIKRRHGDAVEGPQVHRALYSLTKSGYLKRTGPGTYATTSKGRR